MTLTRLLSLGLILATSACVSAGGTVAFADMQIALRECREGQVARQELMGTFRTYQETLDRRKEELLAERAQIVASRERGEDVHARQAAFEQKMVTVHNEYLKLQKDLTEAEQRRVDQILNRLRRILREQAQARGISQVSESRAAQHDGRRYVDLTADVVHAADADAPPDGGPGVRQP